ncbi:MAG: sigma-70 family RNA polymerase sigma factor [Cyanobacteria bacterium J06560_6]
MRSRQDLTEVFSTYIHFESDRFGRWLSEPRLCRSFAKALNNDGSAIDEMSGQLSEDGVLKNAWAMYWYQQWKTQTHGWAFMHLVAYFQETGFWAARDITNQFEPRQFSLNDCFQVAFARLETGLKKFQPERGAALASFINMFFRSTITNELRRAREVDICSNWLLLRKTSRKRFVESLQRAGLSADTVEQYRLAWMCFRHFYAQYQGIGTKKLPPPSVETWQAIADLYNRERLSQLTTAGPAASVNEIESWLLDAIAHIRSYLQPAAVSLNVTVPGMETGELLDNLAADTLSPTEQLFEAAEQASRQAEQQKFRQFLAMCFDNLEPAEKTLLTLYYQDNLTQKQIAQQLDIQQFNVSRRLSRLRGKLLKQSVHWAQGLAENPKAAIAPIDIKDNAYLLEAWLHNYFKASGPVSA